MTWLIIIVALFAAFGPLLWMMPSRADRRLAKMRARARTHGIHVEITQLDDLDAEPQARVTSGGVKLEPKVMCAAYRLGMRRLARAAPQWKILRKSGANDGPIDGWIWATRPAGDSTYWQEVGEVLRALPSDALACATDASEVTCWWRERTTAEDAETSVDRLHAVLQNLAEIQLLADAAASAIDASDDTSDDASTRQ
ncbi:MAG TPA: hypothetical protein VL379_09735 [Pseudomonadales bacterium]|nr:hypothetical protein [Pseudomonadales bacterium]